MTAPDQTGPGTPLMALADLPDPGACGVTVRPAAEGASGPGSGSDSAPIPLIVVHHRGQVFGYVNRCPHNGVRLDFVPGTFLSSDGRRLRCGTHGARFRLTTGRCTRGPCRGAALTPVPLAVDGAGRVVLAGRLPEAPFF